jgi:hypothetical protein
MVSVRSTRRHMGSVPGQAGGFFMVMAKQDPRWIRLVKGETTHQFKSLPAGLLISRIHRQVKGAPGDPKVLQTALDEVHAFFTKYESILTDDLKAIFG